MLKTKHGFTLIELLIVIAILGVFVSVALPNLNGWMATTKARTKADGVLGGFNLARTEAMKRNQRVAITVSADSGWVYGCVITSTDCPAVIERRAASEGGGSVTLDFNEAGSVLTYNGMGMAVPNADASAAVSQIDFSSTGGTVWSVVISPTGRARLCTESAQEGDVNKC